VAERLPQVCSEVVCADEGVRTQGPSLPRRLPGPERDVRTTKTAPQSSTKRALHGVRVSDHNGTCDAPTTPRRAQYYVRLCKSLGNERAVTGIGNCIHGAGGTTRAAMPRRRSARRSHPGADRTPAPPPPTGSETAGMSKKPRSTPATSSSWVPNRAWNCGSCTRRGGYLDTYWVPLLADGGYLPNATSASGRRLDLVSGSWQASGR